MKIPIQQARLIQRTAWQQIQPRKMCADEENRLAKRAVRMLTYVACLDYAMYDLESDLRGARKLHCNVARYFYNARRIVNQAHQAAYNMLMSVNKNIGREYNTMLDDAWENIEKCVLIQPPERGYNIVVALCRLVESLNKELGCRYYFAPAVAIARIPSLLDCVGVRDYEIDVIIDKNVKL